MDEITTTEPAPADQLRQAGARRDQAGGQVDPQALRPGVVGDVGGGARRPGRPRWRPACRCRRTACWRPPPRRPCPPAEAASAGTARARSPSSAATSCSGAGRRPISTTAPPSAASRRGHRRADPGPGAGDHRHPPPLPGCRALLPAHRAPRPPADRRSPRCTAIPALSAPHRHHTCQRSRPAGPRHQPPASRSTRACSRVTWLCASGFISTLRRIRAPSRSAAMPPWRRPNSPA